MNAKPAPDTAEGRLTDLTDRWKIDAYPAADLLPSIERMPAFLADLDTVLRDLRRERSGHIGTMAERDHAQGSADKLAYAIAPVEIIGEHSSGNDPWANALDVLAERALATPATWTAPDGTVLDLSRQIFDRDGEAWALVRVPPLTVGMVDGDASDRTLPELFARYGPLTNEGEEL